MLLDFNFLLLGSWLSHFKTLELYFNWAYYSFILWGKTVRISDFDNNNNQRVMHKDIERKRRQDLSKLLSLRTLLPPHQIKGKRSMCDQVEEAANYIAHMQNQELRIRRDKMKQLLSGAKIITSNLLKGSSGNLLNRVSVNPVHEGLEILITSTSTSVLGLSKVMAVLLERELDVFSCISTKTNTGMFLHKIEVETIGNVTSLDLSVLQQRLTDAIN